MKALAHLPRPSLSWFALNLLAATFIMLAYNRTFWSRAGELFEGKFLLIAVFGAAVWALTLLIVTLFGFRWLQKPVLVFLLILAAVTSYYQDSLGATIDREMIQNALTTTVTESKHLITFDFISHVLLLGILPAALVLWVRIKPTALWRNTWTWGLTVAASALLCVGFLLINLKTYSVILRANKELMASYQPGAPLAGTLRFARMMQKSAVIVAQPYGTDAKMTALRPDPKKPALIVIVAGETARAESWSLNGYARDTNPELAKRDIAYFPATSSCGTATAVSLPCMFSPLTRATYSYDGGLGTENLLDVMAHAGYAVEWWDNNTGDKNVATRQKMESVINSTDPRYCADGECTDGIFLDKLKDYAANLTRDTVLVLHMIGSHGPAYYLRYPDEFRRFTPTCDTSELKNCTSEQITNTYDNTILYTDHIVASMIDILDADTNILPSLFYVSDHGESLGENGLYLHGAPYFMAPTQQTHVPMLMWIPPRYSDVFTVTVECLKTVSGQTYSHDNLFHTVLTLGHVQTEVKDPGLDIFSSCPEMHG